MNSNVKFPVMKCRLCGMFFNCKEKCTSMFSANIIVDCVCDNCDKSTICHTIRIEDDIKLLSILATVL